MERKRLVADRFRRIWHVVEHIAAEPGHSRRELAEKFHLSERQVQADLNIIRSDMRLPLVRRSGYRFVSEGPMGGAGCPDLREAQLLVMILGAVRHDRSIPKGRIAALAAKLPGMFPSHLTPIVERTLDAVTSGGAGQQRVFAGLADALLHSSWVKLHYPPGDYSCPVPDPIMRPELLLPYLSSWYVVGEVQRGSTVRTMMLNIDAVTAVTLAGVPS